MPRNLKTQAQLQAEISQLKQELTHLRTLLKVISETANQAINPEKPQPTQEETNE
jgi:ribosomal protein L29